MWEGIQKCDAYMNGKHMNETQDWRQDYEQEQEAGLHYKWETGSGLDNIHVWELSWELLRNVRSCVEVTGVNAETWKWSRPIPSLSENVTWVLDVTVSIYVRLQTFNSNCIYQLCWMCTTISRWFFFGRESSSSVTLWDVLVILSVLHNVVGNFQNSDMLFLLE